MMLAPQQTTTTTTWPIPGDVPDLETIITDQAETIEQQAVLIDAYQFNLNLAQSPPTGPVATATGTTTGLSTTLAATILTGSITVGSTVTDGTLVPAGTTVLGQISGTTGGTGSYLLSQAINLPAATNLTFTPPAIATVTAQASGNGTSLTVTGVSGPILTGARVTDTATATVPAGTIVLGQISGPPGGAGVYLTSLPTTAANTLLTFTTPVGPTWPIPTDAPTLNLIVQQQTAIIRTQTALLQHYQDLLNTSQTPAPATGP